MLNEEKIKLMTELALYEKKEKQDLEEAKKYFKGDYIAKHLIESFFGFSFSYLLISIILVLYGVQPILEANNIFDISDMIKLYIISYFICLIGFEIISAYIYSRRYDRVKKKNDEYILRLTKLNKRYDFMKRTKELVREEDNA